MNTSVGSEDGVPEPDLVETAEFTSDNMHTVTLKEGLTFANGNELTSENVKHTFDRQLAIVISGGQPDAWGGILAAVLSITVVFLPQYLRVIRAEVVRLKAEPVVEAAKVVGTGHRRIMGDLHPQRLRVDPHPRGAGLPRLRHRADQRLRMGLRPQPCHVRRDQRHLVDGAVPGPRDRAGGARGDARGRKGSRGGGQPASAPESASRTSPPYSASFFAPTPLTVPSCWTDCGAVSTIPTRVASEKTM